MNVNRSGHIRSRVLFVVWTFAGIAIFAYGGLALFERAASAQSDRYLESRINQIEQRFYQIESRINRVEQDSITRRSVTSPQLPDVRSQEISSIQNEIIGLRGRVGELECGVLKLDERTLSASRRLSTRAAQSGSDRCRQDWASPVYLTARP
jgi:hypothetical protein